MTRIERSVFYIARFVIEAHTPLSIGTGGSDGVYDHPIVRDANELPMIPGTSLAGVLRHLWAQDAELDSANALFGYQDRDQGEASRLEVAACVLQDSRGQPVEGLLLGDQAQRLHTDPLLAAAVKTRENPVFRDRVRLTHRGVAANTGKFDRGLLPAGHRFSGELRLWSAHTDDPDWDRLLRLLADPRLRLGGGTRAGLGAMQLMALDQGQFDLRKPADINAFQQLSPRLHDTQGLAPKSVQARQDTGVQTLSITLKPHDFWRIGQGDTSLLGATRQAQAKTPDLLPKQEPKITWEQDQASVGKRFALVPGSAVKGALAHRTAFHWNILKENYVDNFSVECIRNWDKSEKCEGVIALFGTAKNQDRQEQTGQAGHIVIDDVHVDISPQELTHCVQTQIHNSIDRFTGGVRNRMLFTEELIYQKSIKLTITLLPGAKQAEADARRAFAQALRDLCAGRLALGGGTTKGHGLFTGQPDETTQAWLEAQEQQETAQ